MVPHLGRKEEKREKLTYLVVGRGGASSRRAAAFLCLSKQSEDPACARRCGAGTSGPLGPEAAFCGWCFTGKRGDVLRLLRLEKEGFCLQLESFDPTFSR